MPYTVTEKLRHAHPGVGPAYIDSRLPREQLGPAWHYEVTDVEHWSYLVAVRHLQIAE